MGYEHKFYVGEKIKLSPNEPYFFEIARFDLCKMGYNSKTYQLVKDSPPTDLYVYSDDGNTKIREDAYGEPLKEIELKGLIRALKKDDDGYRRIKPMIAFLKALDLQQGKEIVVLHYGY